MVRRELRGPAADGARGGGPRKGPARHALLQRNHKVPITVDGVAISEPLVMTSNVVATIQKLDQLQPDAAAVVVASSSIASQVFLVVRAVSSSGASEKTTCQMRALATSTH